MTENAQEAHHAWISALRDYGHGSEQERAAWAMLERYTRKVGVSDGG